MHASSLELVLSRIPELPGLLKDVPNVQTRLRRLLGPHAEPTWNTDDPAALTLLFLIAGVTSTRSGWLGTLEVLSVFSVFEVATCRPALSEEFALTHEERFLRPFHASTAQD